MGKLCHLWPSIHRGRGMSKFRHLLSSIQRGLCIDKFRHRSGGDWAWVSFVICCVIPPRWDIGNLRHLLSSIQEGGGAGMRVKEWVSFIICCCPSSEAG